MIPTRAAAVPEDGAIHHTALKRFAIIPKSTWIRFLRASGNTENMKRTIPKNAPRINSTTPRTKTFITDGAICRNNFRKNCPLEGERLPQSRQCIENPIEQWRKKFFKLSTQFIQETVVWLKSSDGLWVAWRKLTNHSAPNIWCVLKGKGENQTTSRSRTSQPQHFLQSTRLGTWHKKFDCNY